MTNRATYLCTLLAGTLLVSACGGGNEPTEQEPAAKSASALPASQETQQPTDGITSPAPEPQYESKAVALEAPVVENASEAAGQPTERILAVQAATSAAVAPLTTIYVSTTGNDQ